MKRSWTLTLLVCFLSVSGAFAKNSAIVASYPPDGAINISVLTTVSIVLNVPLDAMPVTLESISLYRLDGDMKIPIKGRSAFDTATHTIEFKPDRPLGYGKRYQFSLLRPVDSRGAVEASIFFTTYRNPLLRRVYYQQGRVTNTDILGYDADGRLDQVITVTQKADVIADEGTTQSIAKYFYDTQGREAKVITYAGAGKDGVWQSADDDIDFYQASSYDSQGNYVANLSAYGAGLDQRWLTADDEARNYFVYTYDADKRLISETMYVDRGKDGIVYTVDDRPNYYETFSYDSAGVMTQSKRYNSAGNDKRWFTDDDDLQYYTKLLTPVGGKEAGRISYAPGADGKWFSEDDVIQSYRLSRYALNKVTYIYGAGAGNDGVWFNNDDAISHYTEYQSDAAGNPMRFVKYNGAAADGLWFTHDDAIKLYILHQYNNKGIAIGQIHYSGPGADGVWFSADDKVASYETYSIDTNGNRREEVRYKGAGPDGLWRSGDDEIDFVFSYDFKL